MEMNRQAHLLLERRHQLAGGGRFAQARHIFDAKDMGAGLFKFFRHRDVVLQRVFLFIGIGEIAAVANCGLAQATGLADLVDRDPHILDPVQAIEDAEHIDARIGRLLDEIAHHVVGIVGVADRVGRAQQHLRHQSWASPRAAWPSDPRDLP